MRHSRQQQQQQTATVAFVARMVLVSYSTWSYVLEGYWSSSLAVWWYSAPCQGEMLRVSCTVANVSCAWCESIGSTDLKQGIKAPLLVLKKKYYCKFVLEEILGRLVWTGNFRNAQLEPELITFQDIQLELELTTFDSGQLASSNATNWIQFWITSELIRANKYWKWKRHVKRTGFRGWNASETNPLVAPRFVVVTLIWLWL